MGGAGSGGARERIAQTIEQELIEIVVQPIVALASREVVGHEALARFTAGPAQAPVEWFREAWEVGLGTELELTAIRLALDRAATLPPGTYLSFNSSPATVEHPDLLELLDRPDSPRVVIEVTEHTEIGDYGRFRRAISRTRERGASLAVDHAGSGFASLRHIHELDAEIIKLDRSLTYSLDADLRRRSLAAALIEFGRETGAAVLAEGIESELQLYELRRLGVRFGQGFHLGRPRFAPANGAPH
ncbi:MAG TPA: EAL domain-containing protein [Thermoleophilaceae bacterium]|nr:EAL domain-containing protein [Thermoleophilaceae bacterium]